jgi:hypothetical protein
MEGCPADRNGAAPNLALEVAHAGWPVVGFEATVVENATVGGGSRPLEIGSRAAAEVFTVAQAAEARLLEVAVPSQRNSPSLFDEGDGLVHSLGLGRGVPGEDETRMGEAPRCGHLVFWYRSQRVTAPGAPTVKIAS